MLLQGNQEGTITASSELLVMDASHPQVHTVNLQVSGDTPVRDLLPSLGSGVSETVEECPLAGSAATKETAANAIDRPRGLPVCNTAVARYVYSPWEACSFEGSNSPISCTDALPLDSNSTLQQVCTACVTTSTVIQLAHSAALSPRMQGDIRKEMQDFVAVSGVQSRQAVCMFVNSFGESLREAPSSNCTSANLVKRMCTVSCKRCALQALAIVPLGPIART